MSQAEHHQSQGRTRVLARGHTFLESPRWHGGAFWASDFYTRRVLRFTPDGDTSTVCEVPGQPSGLGWRTDGTLLIVSMTDRRLLSYHEGSLEQVADLSPYAPWHCNDMAVDADGRAYIGHFGWDDTSDPAIQPASLLRVDPDGTVSVAADDLAFPNGIAISPDGETLLVAETFAARITAFDRRPDGTLENRRVWASFLDGEAITVNDALAAGAPLVDGIALDAEGALWVGDAGGRAALRIAPGGEILDRVSTLPFATYAVALGGDDGRTLHLVTATPYGSGDPRDQNVSAVLTCRVDVPVAR